MGRDWTGEKEKDNMESIFHAISTQDLKMQAKTFIKRIHVYMKTN